MKVILNSALARRKQLLSTSPYDDFRDRLLETARFHVENPPIDLEKTSRVDNLYIVQNLFLEMSLAFRMFEDERYLEHTLKYVSRLSKRKWLAPNFPWEIHWGYTLTGCLVAYDLARDHLRPQQTDALLELILEIAKYLDEQSQVTAWGTDTGRGRNSWNHKIVPYAALLHAGIQLREEYPKAIEWIEKALPQVRLFLKDGVTESGMTREGLYYCGFVFRQVGLVLHAAMNTGVYDFTQDEPVRKKLANIPHWYYISLFPNGKYFLNINDSHMNPQYAMFGFLTTFAQLRPGLAAHVWDLSLGRHGLGTMGQDKRMSSSSLFETILFYPEERELADTELESLAQFADTDGGFFASKTSVGGSTSVFSFRCGPFLRSHHSQSDINSFTLTVDGVPLLLDGGYSNLPEERSPSSTWGHNGLLIDGRGQWPSGAGRGVSGRVVWTRDTQDVFVVVGDATEAYSHEGYNPVRRAIRTCTFVKAPVPYVLVYDDVLVRPEEKHEYSFLLHTLHPKEEKRGESTLTLELEFENEIKKLEVMVLHPPGISMVAEEFPGPANTPIKSHRLYRLSCERVNPHFVVLIVPGGERPIRSEVRHTETELLVDVAFEGREDSRTFVLRKKTMPLGLETRIQGRQTVTKLKEFLGRSVSGDFLRGLRGRMAGFGFSNLLSREPAPHYRLLKRSGVFDGEYYLERYPDIAKAGVDPILHYLTYGAAEGRNPNADFDTRAYQKEHPEAAGMNPLAHYLRHSLPRRGRTAPELRQGDQVSYIASVNQKEAEKSARSRYAKVYRSFAPGHFYSPIPNLDEIEKRQERIFGIERKELAGIDLNEKGQLELLERFSEFYGELRFPVEKSRDWRYCYTNRSYSYGDAIILYSMIRYLHPKKIIEIGSGYSSAAILDINEKHFYNRIETQFIEPYPELLMELLSKEDQARIQITPSMLQDVPRDFFEQLSDGDVLFIDSTHVAKVGSDVQYIFSEILPSLNRGVVVHFHDIFYPFEYPREWLFKKGCFWNEAYVLRAFLQYNTRFQIQYFGHFMVLFHRERIKEKLPLVLRSGGGNIWLRRID